MKKDHFFQIISSIISAIAIMIALILSFEKFDFLPNLSVYIRVLIGFGGVIISVVLVIMTTGVLRKGFPRKFSVATIGFPNTGKTTLLMTLYDQILSKRIDFYKIRIMGTETIERVNKNISFLKNGAKIPSTTDQDVYAYRTTIETKTLFSKNLVQVEFGDFPGEQSKMFAEKYENWFHRTPYFRWVKDANAYVFVIDIGEYLISKFSNNFNEYRAKTISSMRASWQHLIEYNYDIKLDIARNPLILVFSKSDVLAHYIVFLKILKSKELKIDENVLIKYLRYITYEKIPLLNNDNHQHVKDIRDMIYDFLNNNYNLELDQDVYTELLSSLAFYDFQTNAENFRKDIEEDFKELIDYFKKESKYFNKLFMSSFGIVIDHEDNNQQFKKLLDFIFPNL